jgi:gluconate 2-dehydrogenase subunit 3-like protein
MAKRDYTRRAFLARAGRAGAAGAVASSAPLGLLAPPAAAAQSGVLSKNERRTLTAAVARIVPAERAGDWSAADVGADDYIVGLLAGIDRIYAGGPVRSRFKRFQRLWRVKRIGWTREVRRLRGLYKRGLADLDARAGGDFASIPAGAQDAILTALDLQADEFFAALFNHTMEGVYAHPVYGGNRNFRAWKHFGYQGDVHGVRFPRVGPAKAPWNVHGGYAPQEMIEPGKGST